MQRNREEKIKKEESAAVRLFSDLIQPAASAGPCRLQLVALLSAHCYYHYCDQTKAGQNVLTCKNADVEICRVAGRRYIAIDTSI